MQIYQYFLFLPICLQIETVKRRNFGKTGSHSGKVQQLLLSVPSERRLSIQSLFANKLVKIRDID